MVELPKLDNDLWSTFPIKKELLRELIESLTKTERDRNMYAEAFASFYDALELIAKQGKDSKARKIARGALLW